jgi:putative hydrolase of the HAD superfamily
MPPITAISFDADDTLWDFGTAMALALAVSVARLDAEGVNRPDGPLTVDWLAEVRDETCRAMPGATLDESRLAAFEHTLERCGRPDAALARSLFDEYTRERHGGLTLYPEVREVLTALAERYPLAVTTNGNTDPAAAGIGELFAFVTNPYESGFQKPDPRIFHRTAERLGADPATVLHVGDHFLQDALGARDAGLQARWLNRRGPGPTSERAAAEGIGEIPSLRVLLDL